MPGGNDNETRLPRAFADAGWTVTCFDRESLAVHDRTLLAKEATSGKRLSLHGFNLYFALGFGAKATFLDRMQMLRTLDQARFVNGADALIHQHGKISLLLTCPDVPQPESHLSNDPAHLASLVEQGGDWVLKPAASSFGRDVFRVSRQDTNAWSLIESLTRDGRYALLQTCLPTAERGEKRALLVAGTILGAYRKVPADHRGNLDAGATAHPTSLANDERTTLARLAARLCDMGVRFATVDLVGEHVLEINVANPGWLKTFHAISGDDLAPRVVARLTDWARASAGNNVRTEDGVYAYGARGNSVQVA